MENVMINANSSVAVSRMLQIFNTKNGVINVPVKGGLILPYVNGIVDNSSSESISVLRAIELNNIIEKLAKTQGNKITQLYSEYKSGKMKESRIIEIMRKVTTQHNENKFHPLINNTQGLLVDMKI